MKIANLLHVGGEKLEEIYEAKRDKNVEKINEKYEAIVKMFENHFEPEKKVELSILKFRQAFQRSGEGKDAFSIRLRTLACGCDF